MLSIHLRLGLPSGLFPSGLALRITQVLDFVHCPEFSILENTFWKLDLFPSSDKGMETPTLLGPLERGNFNHWRTCVILHQLYKHQASGWIREINTRTFSCYISRILPDAWCLYDAGCPQIEVNSFSATQQSMCLLHSFQNTVFSGI
jgi:hypothetical protein